MSDVTLKKCTQCGEEKPATTEYFHRRGDGFRNECKVCARHKRAEHTEERRAYSRRYAAEHREERRQYGRRHYAECREQYNEYSRRWYIEHGEEMRQWNRRYRIEHAEAMREYNRHYDAEHREEKRMSRRRRRADNPEKVHEYGRACNHRRRARKLNSEGAHTAADIRLQWKSQTDRQGRLRCWWCGGVIVGADYHVDHRIPLARGGSNGAENIVIAHPTCNLSKGAKTPQEIGRLL